MLNSGRFETALKTETIMNDQQENKLSMYLAVQKVCADNNSVWSGLPAFVASFSSFEDKISDIEDVRLIQEQDTTGIAKDKTVLKEELVDKAIEVSTAVQAYASDNGDNELLESLNFSRSVLLNGRDTELQNKCQTIHDNANAIVGSLSDYGIAAADLTELQSKIDDYAAIIPKPRTATSNKKTATEDITLHLKEADSLLNDKLDKLIEQFKTSDAEFYSTYFNARLIVDLGRSGSTLRGTVTDSTTSDRVLGATVEILETEDSRNVNGQGKYSFKQVRPGIYTVRATAEGYEVKEIPEAEIIEGQLNVLDIELDRVIQEPLPEPDQPQPIN